LERVHLLADGAGPDVGADRRAAGTRDEQRHDQRARLLDHREHARGTRERLGAKLLCQRADLERDHRTERDGDERRGQDRDAGDEPELLDELAYLEGALERQPQHLGGQDEQLPGLAQRAGAGERHVLAAHDWPPRLAPPRLAMIASWARGGRVGSIWSIRAWRRRTACRSGSPGLGSSCRMSVSALAAWAAWAAWAALAAWVACSAAMV